ncbi:MAG: NAD(P)H-quinone oxidoreductase [Rhodothalassiaceae bacterium]
MKAAIFDGKGGPDVIRLVERPDPEPGPGEVLISVVAAGINRPDVAQREGRYPPPPGASDIPGLEVSGHVLALGPGVTGFAPGDAVCALVTGGGYAERVVAPVATVLPAPKSLPLAHAAGLPETVFTVWSNLFDRGALAPHEWALVHGGSSGIGSMAIQIARAFDAHIIVTAGSEAKCAFCLGLGADAAINYRERDFVAEIEALTGGRGVDVVLDMVGGDYVPRNIACLAPDGRHVSIAFLRGAETKLSLASVMMKRLTLTGSTLRARPLDFKAALAESVREFVWPLIGDGRIAPVIDSRFPLEEAANAHRHMDSGQHMGKILLDISAG